jgi:cytoskeletal protein CcmA (bactofilin family)
MFGKAKGSSREKDEPLPPAPQLQDLTPANLAESNSTDISYIGPGMTVVGKISSEGTLNVFGRVEGQLHASIVRISNGARVEGAIAAQDLTIGGGFKGTIQANRVTLTSSAVVEGEIHHRSLAIEENAWFAGVSRPEEASASEATDSRSSVQLMPTDGSRQIKELKNSGTEQHPIDRSKLLTLHHRARGTPVSSPPGERRHGPPGLSCVRRRWLRVPVSRLQTGESKMTSTEYTRPDCPQCVPQTYLARIEPAKPGHDLRTSNVRGVSTSRPSW